MVRRGERLTLSEKWSRLALRLHDPEWRRYGMLPLKGKAAGVGLVLLIMFAVNFVPTLPALLGGAAANASDVDVKAEAVLYPAMKASDIVNPLNTLWTLLAAFLVYGMQVGFKMREAGFCRSRETVNVLMECIVDTCLCGVLFFGCGFAFMFGSGHGLVGR